MRMDVRDLSNRCLYTSIPSIQKRTRSVQTLFSFHPSFVASVSHEVLPLISHHLSYAFPVPFRCVLEFCMHDFVRIVSGLVLEKQLTTSRERKNEHKKFA